VAAVTETGVAVVAAETGAAVAANLASGDKKAHTLALGCYEKVKAAE
jgi:hypothetical protein